MSPKLAILQRRMNLQMPEPAPAPESGHGLGAAIEKIISDEVTRRVDEAMAERAKQPARVRNLFNAPEPVTDYRLPATPKTAPLKGFVMNVERDGASLARALVVDGERFLLQRDGAGNLIRVVSDSLVSEVRYDGKPVPTEE